MAPTWTKTLFSRERLAWAVYDWANSAFVLCVITVVGPAYFISLFHQQAWTDGFRVGRDNPTLPWGGMALTAEAAWSFLIALSALAVMVLTPVLGAMADGGGYKKRMLALFCWLGVAATAALYWPMAWWQVGLLIMAANIGFEGGNVFYNAFLPQIAQGGQRHLLSGFGFALGYVGSVVVLLAAMVWFIPYPQRFTLTFLLVAAWWGGFALWTFWGLEEWPVQRRGGLWRQAGQGWRELWSTLKGMGRYPQALTFLLAYLLYNDAIATLITNTTPFALQNLYLDAAHTRRVELADLIPALLLVQLVAAPGSMVLGWTAARWGEKATLLATLAVFSGVLIYAQWVTLLSHFYLMAALVGLVWGGAQSVSRSMFAGFVPQGSSAQFYAFYGMSQKMSAMLGPLVYGLLVLLTGSTRLSLLGLTLFFVAGGLVLWRVNPDVGRAQARY